MNSIILLQEVHSVREMVRGRFEVKCFASSWRRLLSEIRNLATSSENIGEWCIQNCAWLNHVMRFAKVPPLLLALLLQIVPLCKTVAVNPVFSGSSFAIVLRWGIGATAILAGYDAVSGATTTSITSARTAKATAGVPFTYRVTTNSRQKDRGTVFLADPLPAGLSIQTIYPPNSIPYALIVGTPTETGIWLVHLMAVFQRDTAELNLTLTVSPNVGLSPPLITSQPAAQNVTIGSTASFSVVASGSAPLTYQWKFNGADIPGQTGSTLTLNNIQASQSGDYSVVVSNSGGSTTSQLVHLTVQIPQNVPVVLNSPTLANGALKFHVTGPIGAKCVVWTSADLVNWRIVESAVSPEGAWDFSEPLDPHGSLQFFRATVEP